MLSWAAYVVCVIVGYIGISVFAQLSSGAVSPVSAFFSAMRPLPLLVATLGNMFFGLGLYYGFGLTRFALPIAISLGVITSFVYSVVLLGATITFTKIVGAFVILIGIVLMTLS